MQRIGEVGRLLIISGWLLLAFSGWIVFSAACEFFVYETKYGLASRLFSVVLILALGWTIIWKIRKL